jgi:ATP-dependent exoDNAse (exonuclease V) beta subunit
MMLVERSLLPTNKHHISSSELTTWSQCSWRHRRSQVDKDDRSSPSPVPTFGTAVHEASERFLTTGVMNADIAHAAIDRLWDRCGFRDPEPMFHSANHPDGIIRDDFADFLKRHDMTPEVARETFKFTSKTQHEAHRDADAILAEVPQFMDAAFPNWQFIAAEFKLYEPIRDTGVNMKGFIDGVIAATGKNNRGLVWIIDWKTSAWGWRREKRQDPLVQNQLMLYKRYWLQNIAASNPALQSKDVRCGFVILKRSAKPGEHCELIPISASDAALERAERRALNMIASVRHSVALKDRTSCLYCEYNDECVGSWVDHRGQLHHVAKP